MPRTDMSEMICSMLRQNVVQLFSIAEGIPLDTSTKNALQVVGDEIQNLLEKNTFTIAVIGEYNDGKSSLINALLKDPDLLVVKGGDPTTSVVTYIQYGEQLDIRVECVDGVELEFRKDYSAMRTFFDKLKDIRRIFIGETKHLAEQMKQFIEKITTSSYEDSQRDIARITIFHPSSWLRRGIVLIDTPGCNVEQPHHRRATEHIVKIVDACILLFNANQIGRESYFSFLKKHVPQSIDKIFFVINKIDKAISENDDEDQDTADELVRYLRKKIYQELDAYSGRHPKIYCVAAKQVIQALKGRRGDFEYFLKIHEQLESDLRTFMENERNVLVIQKSCRLELEFAKNIQNKIQQLKEEFKYKLKKLKASRIFDLDSFIAQEKDELNIIANERLDHFHHSWKWHWGAKEKAIIEQIHHQIDLAQNKEQLRSIIERNVRTYLKCKARYKLEHFRDRVNQEFSEEMQKIARDLQRRFEDHYRDVGLDSKKAQACCRNFSDFSSDIKAEIPIDDICDKISSGILETCLGGISGAGAGAVIGSLVGSPGIGTIVGAAIGGAIGLCWRTSLEEAKLLFKKQAKTHTNAELDKIANSLKQSFENTTQLFSDFMHDLVAEYSKHFKKSIEEAIQTHKQQEADIRREIQRLGSNLPKLKIIEQALERIHTMVRTELDQIRGSETLRD